MREHRPGEPGQDESFVFYYLIDLIQIGPALTGRVLTAVKVVVDAWVASLDVGMHGSNYASHNGAAAKIGSDFNGIALFHR